MQPTAQAGYEWKSAEKVAEFLDREETDPERKAEHESAHDHMLSLLPFDANAAIQFLDVGAGAGAVSISLMRRFGYATGVLADMSEAMMEAGTETLVPFDGRYRYVEYDMNSPEWPADLKGPFDLAVSARAIHHLTDDQKLVVFRHIHNWLKTGGVFVNWDLFPKAGRVPDPNNAHDRTVATIERQMELMEQAGFADVSHSHVQGRRAIFFGKRAR